MAPTMIRGRRVLPFRIPFFRVFYSLTYTALYLLTLVFLAITPISMLYSTIEQLALQYTIMIGGSYVLTAIIAIFIYSSRLYTNRSVISAVGKPYVPIEDGEVGKSVRKMIVKQLRRSAIVAWEGRPRDLFGEILWGEREGVLHQDSDNMDHDDYTLGTEIVVDPSNPPWGDVQHAGWTSPSHRSDNKNPHVRFAEIVAELPNLVEARAASLAAADPTASPVEGQARPADPAVVDLLTRPANMAMREYLTQLGYLGLLQPPEIGQDFLLQYEKARFGGRPSAVEEFNALMQTFAKLLAGMTGLKSEIVKEICVQSGEQAESTRELPLLSLPGPSDDTWFQTPSPRPQSPQSSVISPVTAHEVQSTRVNTPFSPDGRRSEESFSSGVHRTWDDLQVESHRPVYNVQAPSSSTLPSDAGSVLVHDVVDNG
ncbi:hypothetical protein AC579_912 [Pseudocercospora musae]|uniref:Defect at low temperature protein 1 n=1 Tax=Pseudocercospora musae TaxID=113226 RepID=A0A139INK7_9PEZI|nr:hypothetical protein AC579_912 [Pseudocercospora musae]